MQTPTPFRIDLRDPVAPMVAIDGQPVATVGMWLVLNPGDNMPTVTLAVQHPGVIEGVGHVRAEYHPDPTELADLIVGLPVAEVEEATSRTVRARHCPSAVAMLEVVAAMVVARLAEVDG